MTQASAALPENTLASFEAAIRDGAEGIETGMFSTPIILPHGKTRSHVTCIDRCPHLQRQCPHHVSRYRQVTLCHIRVPLLNCRA